MKKARVLNGLHLLLRMSPSLIKLKIWQLGTSIKARTQPVHWVQGHSECKVSHLLARRYVITAGKQMQKVAALFDPWEVLRIVVCIIKT